MWQLLNVRNFVIQNWKRRGSTDGQFNWPRGMLLDSSNNLLVCDCDNNRVQQFSLDGRFTGKTITDLLKPAGIATASLGFDVFS